MAGIGKDLPHGGGNKEEEQTFKRVIFFKKCTEVDLPENNKMYITVKKKKKPLHSDSFT